MKVLIFFLAVVVLACPAVTNAEDEEIILTTYYPAPYGEYERLGANSMAIGPNYVIPTAAGDLIIEGNLGIGTDTPTVRLEVVGNIIADDPTEDNHVATRRYVKSHAISYDLSGVEVFTASQETGTVTLVDLTHPAGGILLGGSISGNFADSVTITIDAGTADAATLTFTPPFCEVEFGNDDYKNAAFPSPISFKTSIKITYVATGPNNLVGGIAYVFKN